MIPKINKTINSRQQYKSYLLKSIKKNKMCNNEIVEVKDKN